MTLDYLDEYMAYDPGLLGATPNIVEIGCFEPVKRLPLRLAYRAKLHFVEASPTNYATLTSRIPHDADNVVTLHAALVERIGMTTLYEYHHEQLSTVFPRHLQEGIPLRQSTRVPGYALWALLNKLKVDTCDLLLLNCEGAEVFAMRQLAETPGLRARVKQFCTSNHCAHIKCYPPEYWDQLVLDLAPHYEATRLRFPHIPYFLFTQRGATVLPERGARALPRKS